MYKVYSAGWCSYCQKLKKFMDEGGISYTEVDIDEDLDEADHLVARGYETLPQIFDTEGNYKGDCTSFIETYKT